MNSTKIASKLENGSDIQTITYRDVIPNMNKVENVDWQKCGRLGERVVFNVLIQKYKYILPYVFIVMNSISIDLLIINYYHKCIIFI